MKLLIQTSVLLIFTTLSVSYGRPVDVEIPLSVVHNLTQSSSIYPHKSLSIHSSLTKSASSTSLAEPSPTLDILGEFIAPFIDAPAVVPIPDDESDPIVEVPIKEPITTPVEHGDIYSEQLVTNSDQEKLFSKKAIRAIKFNPISRVVNCFIGNEVRCEEFRQTNGYTCSRTSIGVACNTRQGEICSYEANCACHDFTEAAGMFCSDIDCAQHH